MRVENTQFIISATAPKQYPTLEIPEVAMAGRSNVGKSSVINALVRRKNLARTSSVPGKTRHINFYNIDEAIMLADLPGYGYAEAGKSEQGRWADMINAYLDRREQLCAILQIVDARHKPTAQDVQMAEWIRASGKRHIVVANKTDKLPVTKVPDYVRVICDVLEVEDALPFSAEKSTGREELLILLEQLL